MGSNKETQLRAIRDFWSWFSVNAQTLQQLHRNREFTAVAREVNRELDKVEPQLAWEIGPGKNEPNLLTISAEGNATLRPFAEKMIELAPQLKGWEFHSSRPARHPPAVVRLPESAVAFETSGWEFLPVEQPERGWLDLVIVDNQLADCERELALKAVSIYLDELLGEDEVETWIGKFTIEDRDSARGKKAFKLTELPDYLLWATHREKSPLKKPGAPT
jgi:hypothetical protein